MEKGRAIRGRGILAPGAIAMNSRHEKQGGSRSPVPNAVEVKPGVYVAKSSTSVFTKKDK
jgi:hypothetical protein